MRREGRSVSAEPVCSCAVLFAQIARETAGAACTRSSLRPQFSKRANEDANLGRKAPREGETISTVIASEAKQSIVTSCTERMDCVAALAMTWRALASLHPDTLRRPRSGRPEGRRIGRAPPPRAWNPDPEPPEPPGLPGFPAAGFPFGNLKLTKLSVWLGTE